MKKLLIVTIALTLGLFLAPSSFAGIEGSKHDLSSTGAKGVAIDTQLTRNEICVFCHTPHNADIAVTDAPLWNHTATGVTFTPYTSTTLNATVGQPDGISKLCLSCHDGVTALDAYGSTTNFPGEGDSILGTTSPYESSTADLTNLATTHPVSFAYSSALATADTGLVAYDDANVVALVGGVAGGNVECSSCHDVHDNTEAPFLVMANTNSDLCLTCHNK